ncbi:hypothetical protein AB0C12_13210 [Actinoplanes sp. NPDC048967]|uniref:effector-associated constant component EACC1 n=1 Tax=Actinoplanes sp. NPDC048967 TaxID=3155269 RepID=UPI003407DE89
MRFTPQLRYESMMDPDPQEDHSVLLGQTNGEAAIELEISDPAAIPSLLDWLTTVHHLRVDRRSVPGSKNELGAADILLAVVSSSGLYALIRTAPDFIRARREEVKIRITTKAGTIELTGRNVADATELVNKLQQK